MNQFIDAYEKENAKRAKLTYKVKQYLPDKVVISLNPETVSMEKTILNHMQTFYQEHRKDYPGIIEANQAQNKAYREKWWLLLQIVPWRRRIGTTTSWPLLRKMANGK